MMMNKSLTILDFTVNKSREGMSFYYEQGGLSIWIQPKGVEMSVTCHSTDQVKENWRQGRIAKNINEAVEIAEKMLNYFLNKTNDHTN